MILCLSKRIGWNSDAPCKSGVVDSNSKLSLSPRKPLLLTHLSVKHSHWLLTDFLDFYKKKLVLHNSYNCLPYQKLANLLQAGSNSVSSQVDKLNPQLWWYLLCFLLNAFFLLEIAEFPQLKMHWVGSMNAFTGQPKNSVLCSNWGNYLQKLEGELSRRLTQNWWYICFAKLDICLLEIVEISPPKKFNRRLNERVADQPQMIFYLFQFGKFLTNCRTKSLKQTYLNLQAGFVDERLQVMIKWHFSLDVWLPETVEIPQPKKHLQPAQFAYPQIKNGEITHKIAQTPQPKTNRRLNSQYKPTNENWFAWEIT